MPPSDPHRPVVVKLGGSILTRKREAPRVRLKVLDRLAKELAACPDVPLVVLHGAGSFGHPMAMRFGLVRPSNPNGANADRRRGAAIVSAEVRRLHVRVLSEFVRVRMNPWSIPPAALALNRAGTLSRFEARPFVSALELGVVPVSFGDVVPDESWGFSILSADTLALELARTLSAERVVFVSDVPGILATAPDGRRTIVAEVTPEVIASLHPTEGTPDVTGGIRGKAQAMWEIARAGVDAGLISGLSDGALLRAVQGETKYGSWARARPG